MSLSAFAVSCLELGSDMEEGKLFHKIFILSEADFCLIGPRKRNPRRKYHRQIWVKPFTKVDLWSLNEACQTEAVVSERF